MKAARLVVLGVALAAGGVAAFLASGHHEAPPPAAPPPPPPLATIEILIAKTDLDRGQMLTYPVPRLVLAERLQGQVDLPGLHGLVPRRAWPRAFGPVGGGQAPQPGTPVRPVGVRIGDPALPVLPA